MSKEMNNLSAIIPRVLLPFLGEPSREFNVREFARELGISPTTASKYLKRYAEEGILKEKHNRNLKLYRRNSDSPLYRDLKIFYNIRILRNSGLIEALDEHYLSPTIILFGSCSRGGDTEQSDVDLAVISNITKGFSRLPEFERKLGREIQLFPVKTLDGLKNDHLIANVIDGITLQGGKLWNSMSASLRERLQQPIRTLGS